MMKTGTFLHYVVWDSEMRKALGIPDNEELVEITTNTRVYQESFGGERREVSFVVKTKVK